MPASTRSTPKKGTVLRFPRVIESDRFRTDDWSLPNRRPTLGVTDVPAATKRFVSGER
ncbi:hypothetical protein ZOD2009_03425 [Haladaptatus paucihalophilus DX253]|uniref:Uncharacterized protein n=1 Tax=Haladaptatus paucihalophilus DX253 TaxID=797209 RepID=E7QNP5_HALPU|nr:hypothetical protein [Haladaptatus paucihalophilus]EFW94162.1 hypothetical protein ZOD2009_03425 [Haladaptatus paucihalophilus DX253]